MASQDLERLFDVRTVHRHIREGRVTEAQYEAHLAALPDVSDKARPPEETPVESPSPAPPEVPEVAGAAPPAAGTSAGPAADFAAGWDLPDDLSPPSVAGAGSGDDPGHG